MSDVTTVILVLGSLEQEIVISEVNAFFADYPSGVKELAPGTTGGNKTVPQPVLVGAFTAFDLDDFLRHLNGIDFEDAQRLQLFVREEHDATFGVYSMHAGSLRLDVPAAPDAD